MKQRSAKELALRQMIDHWHTVYKEAVEMGDYALAENTYNVTIQRPMRHSSGKWDFLLNECKQDKRRSNPPLFL